MKRLRRLAVRILGALLVPASVAAAPPEVPPAPVRTVPVTLVTNEAYRAASGWQGTARWAIETGTEDLATLAGLRFRVTEDVAWEAPPGDHYLGELLDAGLRALGPIEGIAVFLLAGRPSMNDWGAEAGYALLGRPALVIDPEAHVRLGLDRKRSIAILFRHELGHVFGIPHLDPPDIMAVEADKRGWDYGGISAEILRATRGMDFTARTPFAGCDLDLLGDLYHALSVWGDMEPSLLVNLGVAFRAADRDSAARAVFAEAARLDPESPHARLGLAQSAWALGDTTAARDEAEALEAIDAPPPDLLAARGALWLDLGDAARAERDLTEALAQDPDRAGTWFNLALCRYALEDGAGAATALRRCLALSPQEPLAGAAQRLLERVEGR